MYQISIKYISQGGDKVAAKPLKYSEKIAVSFTPEQINKLKKIADDTGDTVSGILRRLAIKFLSEYEKK